MSIATPPRLPSVSDIIANPTPKPEDKAEQWEVFNQMWRDQVVGQGIKVYEEHCSAKLRACMVGDPWSVYTPDPADPGTYALIKDSFTKEHMEMWAKNAHKPMREADPELWEKMAMACQDRDEKYEKAGVRIIRNTLGWYPDEIINYNAPYNGPEFISIYAGAKWQMTGNAVLVGQSTGACRMAEASSRAALVHLILESPGSKIVPFLTCEPNPASAHGEAGFAVDDWRQMPDRTILWAFGIPSPEGIPEARLTGKDCSAGWPRGKEIQMRLLRELGVKEDEWWFDSKIGYHQDCVFMNLVEGVIGLPDIPGHGIMNGGKLPECIKDWEIFPLPMEDVERGVANSSTVGDGRIFIDSACQKTIDLLDKKGYEPIPIDYQVNWSTFHSGIDCSDANIWRENDLKDLNE